MLQSQRKLHLYPTNKLTVTKIPQKGVIWAFDNLALIVALHI